MTRFIYRFATALLAGALVSLTVPGLAPGATGEAAVDMPSLQEPACEPVERMPLEGRQSPYDSTSVQMGDASIKLCYGRPSARGRTMIGGEAHPFGDLWRTGANEPTTLHTTAPIQAAGITLEPGSYSLYTRPGEESWEIFLNGSVDRWGIPITDEVRESDVGSATVPRQRPDEHVETLTFRFENASADGADLVFEWENFRVVIPVRAG